eukprot:1639542-Pleurochrysis_carterae.AAC.1
MRRATARCARVCARRAHARCAAATGRCARTRAACPCTARCGDGTVCGHAGCVRMHGALRRWDAACAEGLR